MATNKARTYENFYRVHNEKHYLIVPFAGENEQILNKALSDVLLKMFEDSELIQFLADSSDTPLLREMKDDSGSAQRSGTAAIHAATPPPPAQPDSGVKKKVL